MKTQRLPLKRCSPVGHDADHPPQSCSSRSSCLKPAWPNHAKRVSKTVRLIQPKWVPLGSAEAIEKNIAACQAAVRGSAGVSPAPVGVPPNDKKPTPQCTSRRIQE